MSASRPQRDLDGDIQGARARGGAAKNHGSVPSALFAGDNARVIFREPVEGLTHLEGRVDFAGTYGVRLHLRPEGFAFVPWSNIILAFVQEEGTF